MALSIEQLLKERFGMLARESVCPADIIDTIRASLANARGRGERWKAHVEEHLGGIEGLLDKLEAGRAAVKERIGQFQAEMAEQSRQADVFIEEMADDIWDRLGRPTNDPLYQVLFFPVEGQLLKEAPSEEQPDRMDLLADMIEAGVYAPLDTEGAKEFASEIRKRSSAYYIVADNLRRLWRKLKILDALEELIARTGHVQHSNLRRRLREAGFGEAEIREVVPDIGHSERA
jgi:hypothetical protein